MQRAGTQGPDDRNWLGIQALGLRVQTTRSVAARFAMHIFSPCNAQAFKGPMIVTGLEYRR
jgi:hypothetical protein